MSIKNIKKEIFKWLIDQQNANTVRKSSLIFFHLLLLPLLSSCDALINRPIIPTGGINSNAADEHPVYSSDGRYLAFSSDRNGRRNVYLYDLQQRNLINLPNLNRRDSSQDSPSLSADGRYIAYMSNERGKTDIFVYDRQTARSRLLTANVRGSVRHPTISGDGSSVAFQTSERGQWNIAIIEGL